MPLNPKLDQPWFTPLADAIPLAGRPDGSTPGDGTTPPVKPPYDGIGAEHDWDVSLPQCVSSWEETQVDNILRTSVETGLTKQRRLWSNPVTMVKVTMPIKQTQYTQFWTYYNTILKNGLDSFMFRNPFSNTYEVYRFAGVPMMRASTDKMLWVDMTWERVNV